ncbi:MAG: GGDEF domain-containing protein [Desulforhopalus sp.]
MLDIKTLFILLGASHLIGAIVIGFLAFSNRELKGVKGWAIGRLLAAFAIIVLIIRDVVIPEYSSVIIGNLLLCLGLYSALRGNYQIMNRKPLLGYRLFFVFLFAHLSILLYWTIVETNYTYRVALISFVNAMFMLLLIHSLWNKTRKEKLYSKNLLTTSYLVLGSSEFIKASLLLTQTQAGTGLFESSTLTTIPIFIACCCSILTSIGYLALVVELLNQTLIDLSEIDPLTGVLNRRAFFKKAEKTLQHSKNRSMEMSVLFLDIDHFKIINDTYGHETGDCVLKQVSQATSKLLVDQNYFARLGGEEFCIMLLDTNAEEAIALAENIRKAIKTMHPTQKMALGTVTCSIGVSSKKQKQSLETLNELLYEADCAMYRAKKLGRDQVIVFTPDIKLKSDNYYQNMVDETELHLTHIRHR